MKKKIMVLLCLWMALVMSFSAYAGNWEQQGADWYYKNDDGTYAKNTIIDGYYISYTGRMINEAHPQEKRDMNNALKSIRNGTARYGEYLPWGAIPGTHLYMDLVGNYYLPKSSDGLHDYKMFFTQWFGDNIHLNVRGTTSGNFIMLLEDKKEPRIEYINKICNDIRDHFNSNYLDVLELPAADRYRVIYDRLLNNFEPYTQELFYVDTNYPFKVPEGEIHVTHMMLYGRGSWNDYSTYFKLMCNMAGLDCDTTGDVNERWCRLTIDGQQYWVDPYYEETTGDNGFMVLSGSDSRWDIKYNKWIADFGVIE